MNDAPWLTRKVKGGVGRRAEKRTGNRLALNVHPASGAMEGLKGDLSNDQFLLEQKVTEKLSISIKYAWLEKISKEALEKGKEPALVFQFVDGTGAAVAKGSWVAIPERLWKELFP